MSSVEETDAFLEHFGVKGMRWGKHQSKVQKALTDAKAANKAEQKSNKITARNNVVSAKKNLATSKTQVKIARLQGDSKQAKANAVAAKKIVRDAKAAKIKEYVTSDRAKRLGKAVLIGGAGLAVTALAGPAVGSMANNIMYTMSTSPEQRSHDALVKAVDSYKQQRAMDEFNKNHPDFGTIG